MNTLNPFQVNYIALVWLTSARERFSGRLTINEMLVAVATYVAIEEPELEPSLRGISELINLPKSTVSRALRQFVKWGAYEAFRDEEDRRITLYRIGKRSGHEIAGVPAYQIDADRVGEDMIRIINGKRPKNFVFPGIRYM